MKNRSPAPCTLGRVLIVDDQQLYRDPMCLMLQQHGFDARAVESGCDIPSMVSTWTPDVILMDLNMPGMDGIEACDMLRRHPATKHIPVIIFSWLDDSVSVTRGIESGAVDFISKGAPRHELLARITAQLRVRKAYLDLSNQVSAWIKLCEKAATAKDSSDMRDQMKDLASQMKLALE